MAPFYEHPTTGTGDFSACRFIMQLGYLAMALAAVALNPDPYVLCVLGFATANALLLVRPSRRLFRIVPRRTACFLLSWTGHSLETAYFLAMARHSYWTVCWMLLCGAGVAALDYTRYDRVLFVTRGTTWTAVLLFANRAACTFGYSLFVLILIQFVSALLTGVLAALIIILVSSALYGPLCVLQDRLSDWRVRRARGPNGNAWNAAACILPEIQLDIFHLLRTRGRFGAREHLARDIEFNSDARFVPFSGARDLAAASRVCRSWRTAATVALYRDAVLLEAWRTCAFSYALAGRPGLAHLVHRIVLPEWEGYSPDGSEMMYRVKRGEFFAAIEHVVSHCVNATDIRLFRDQTPLLDHIPGLRAAAQHVSHLAIQSGAPHRFSLSTDVPEPEEIDLPLLLGWLPSLTSLTLTGQRVTFDVAALRDAQRRALGSISALYLGACAMDILHLILLLQRLPSLRIAELRDMEYSGSPGTVSITDLFATQLGTLAELRLLAGYEMPAEKRRIVFRALGALSALRTLAVNTYMLPAIVEFPPNLQELIVSFEPRSKSGSLRYMGMWKTGLFNAVNLVSSLAPKVPTLRSVQLWDNVYLTQLAHWPVAAFMLREMLARRGVSLDVNLFVAMIDNLTVKEDFSKRKTLRRLFWKGVL